MICMPRCDEADTDPVSLPERELWAEPAQQVRNRQVAALYLQAATMTDDAPAREFLRRRAAGLISRGCDRRRRLAVEHAEDLV